jgi:hypothetical protein
VTLTIVGAVATEIAARQQSPDESYLGWTASQAQATGERSYKRGRAGSFWGDRGPLQTERAENYKLAATLFSPEMIRATARFIAGATRRCAAATGRHSRGSDGS